MSLRVADLFVYPIKSARGIRLDEAQVDRRGIALDRRWMVVDDAGVFVTQRALPRMALLEVAVAPDHLRVAFPKMPPVAIPRAHDGPRTRVTVWKDTCQAVLAPADVSRWFHEALGVSCRLVHMPDDFTRTARGSSASRPQDEVGFADGFPLLLTSVASLRDLNGRLDVPVPMDRFRPNVVVEGAHPFAEDAWRSVQTSGLTLRAAKPCARCPIVDVDQRTGEKADAVLRALASYRSRDGGAMFGVNLLHDGEGTLRRGAAVVVLE